MRAKWSGFSVFSSGSSLSLDWFLPNKFSSWAFGLLDWASCLDDWWGVGPSSCRVSGPVPPVERLRGCPGLSLLFTVELGAVFSLGLLEGKGGTSCPHHRGFRVSDSQKHMQSIFFTNIGLLLLWLCYLTKQPPSTTFLSLLPLPHLHRRHLPTLPPRLPSSPLLPQPDIPPASTTTAQTNLQQPPHNRRRGRHPHKREHFEANLRHNVHRLLRTIHHVLKDDKHDGSDHVCCCGREGWTECEDGNGEDGPAGVDWEGREEHGDQAGAGAGEEEVEHPVGSEADKLEGRDDFLWESN